MDTPKTDLSTFSNETLAKTIVLLLEEAERRKMNTGFPSAVDRLKQEMDFPHSTLMGIHLLSWLTTRRRLRFCASVLRSASRRHLMTTTLT
jgi:hypothetical protein